MRRLELECGECGIWVKALIDNIVCVNTVNKTNCVLSWRKLNPVGKSVYLSSLTSTVSVICDTTAVRVNNKHVIIF